MAAPLSQVNRNADALVAVVLDGFDLAAPDRNRLPDSLGHLGFRAGGAEPRRVAKNIGRDLVQHVGLERETAGGGTGEQSLGWSRAGPMVG